LYKKKVKDRIPDKNITSLDTLIYDSFDTLDHFEVVVAD